MKRYLRQSLVIGVIAVFMAIGVAAGARAQDKPSAGNDAAAEARIKAAQERASCQNNLKQLGIVMKMFAGEHKDAWAPLDPRPGYLMFVADVIYPEYLTDPNVLFCPAASGAVKELAKTRPSKSNIAKFFDTSSYWYPGYALPTEEEGLAFVDAYKKLVKEGKELPKEIALANGKKVLALRDGVERLLITDPNDPSSSARVQSTVPVLIDRPGSHKEGANVLYMDGHVEFVKYPGKYPMTEQFIKALESIDKLRSTAGK